MPQLPTTMAKERENVSVRISLKVYRLVKAVAGYKGVSVSDYLSEVVQPVAARDWEKINREIAKDREDD